VIAAVVLAAGEGSRFGGAKQRLLLPDVLRAIRASSVDDLVVVAGAHELDIDVTVVTCPEWARGIGASLRCGLRALPPETEAAVVALADGPDLAPAAVDRVIEAWRGGAGDVVAASYDGDRGHPVLLARAVWDRIPDGGARALGDDPILVPCDDLGHPGDVDYVDDVPARLRTNYRG
jgi:CTP:molybdopterin cytidylyltransferase MocA